MTNEDLNRHPQTCPCFPCASYEGFLVRIGDEFEKESNKRIVKIVMLMKDNDRKVVAYLSTITNCSSEQMRRQYTIVKEANNVPAGGLDCWGEDN